LPKRKYVPHDAELPSQVEGSDLWRGHFGEATVKRGIPPPEKRSLQADMWWLLDNVLREGECLDVNRNFDMVRTQVARYIRERKVGRGIIKMRALGAGKVRIWKLASGYEKPD
jgi:hypothetical protein